VTPLPHKKFNIIYADPPWDYGNTHNHSGHFYGIADRHYPVMKLKDIKALPVGALADTNCYLFLWVTSPFMEQAFDVIRAWGFKFATVGFVWVKTTNDGRKVRGDGLGKYTISNAEYCLIARKGQYWREMRNVKQIVMAPKAQHSKKPDEVRERIIELCGALPRIELFARQKTPGWATWGDEV